MKLIEKPQVFIGNKINAGIYIFNPSILDKIAHLTSIENEIFPIMIQEGKLFSMYSEGFWMDVGQPRDFLAGMCLYLNSLKAKSPEALTTGRGIIPPVLVDATAKIFDGCLIGPNCIVHEGVRLANTALLEGTTIGANSLVKCSIIGWRSNIGKWVRITSYKTC